MPSILSVGRLLSRPVKDATPATSPDIEILTRDGNTILTRDGATVIARAA
jgi:hypothetical protein